MPFRPDYVEALELIARVFDDYDSRTRSRPILVGGAAVECYTKRISEEGADPGAIVW